MNIIIPSHLKKFYSVKGDIVKFPHPILLQPTMPVTKFGPALISKVNSMIRLMKKNNGAGLAANQIGWGKSVVIIGSRVLINPEIINSSGEQISEEGCLSLPMVLANIVRPNFIKIKAQKLNGKELEIDFSGFEATVAAHELDHLNGILFLDKCISDSVRWLEL